MRNFTEMTRQNAHLIILCHTSFACSLLCVTFCVTFLCHFCVADLSMFYSSLQFYFLLLIVTAHWLALLLLRAKSFFSFSFLLSFLLLCLTFSSYLLSWTFSSLLVSLTFFIFSLFQLWPNLVLGSVLWATFACQEKLCQKTITGDNNFCVFCVVFLCAVSFDGFVLNWLSKKYSRIFVCIM